MEKQVFESSEENVWKYVFTDDQIVLESVLYKYGEFTDRTVICCSVQSGCKIGCTFCGTGKNFISNITAEQIVDQIQTVLRDKNIDREIYECEKFQIMFMSMGEPMDNIDEVIKAIKRLNKIFPHAQLLLSTIGMKNDLAFRQIIQVSKDIDKVGLQFSLHKSTDAERDVLIPFKKKYNLREIRDRGMAWERATGRKVYLNYCVDETNSEIADAANLMNLFSPISFNMTFSVICEADETMKDAACQNLSTIRRFENFFIEEGYNTRIFDPAGQDDIGGGCGQLWFVQDFLDKK